MSNNHKQDDEIDLIELFWTLWQGKWVIILCSIIGFSSAFIYLRTQPKIFQADLLLQVEQKNAGLGSLLGNIDPLLQGGNEIDSQIEIIKSRSILSKTVEQFHLTSQLGSIVSIGNIMQPVENIPYSKIDFRLNVPNNFIVKEHELILEVNESNKWVLKDNGLVLMSGSNGIAVENSGYYMLFDSKVDLSNREFEVIVQSPLSAIEWLKNSLSINSVDKNSLLRLSFNSQDPYYAAELLNSIASDYVLSNAEQSSIKLAQGAEFIESQLPGLRSQLEQAEQALNNFQTQNQTIDLGAESESLIRTLAQIEGELTTLELKKDDMASRYTVKHPAMQTLYRQQEVLLNRKAEIEQKLNYLPQSSQGFIRLKRDVEVNQAVYLQLLSRLQELNVAKASSVGGVRIIDYAQPFEKAIKPKSIMILLSGLIVGFMLSSMFVMSKYLMRKTIKTIEDITENTGLYVCATIPYSKKQKKLEKLFKDKRKQLDEEHILSISDPQDLSIEGLRSLRTSLHFSMGGVGDDVLLVTGPTENVGKSFVSSNLAILMAGTGKKVVLIDTDLRKGYLDYQFTLDKNKYSLSDFLCKSNINPEDCIHKTKISGLSYVPAGNRPQDPAELLSKEKFNELIVFLRSNFDLVILDTPPILPVSDALQIAAYASSIVLVVHYNKSTIKELQLVESKLFNISKPIIGVVMNGVQISKTQGYYSYHSSYGGKS